ncbi:MAG: CHAT domain-containing tetratricopeptide repeat protein [Candidatus Thiodiazotropha sp.]
MPAAAIETTHNPSRLSTEDRKSVERALSHLKKAETGSASKIADASARLADRLYRAGEHGSAIYSLRLGLTLLEKQRATTSIWYAKTLHRYGVVNYMAGRYAECEAPYREALSLTEAAFGPNHYDTGVILNNIAELYRTLGRLDEAEPLYQRAIAIFESARGPSSAIVADLLNNYGGLQLARNNHKQAERLFNRSLENRRMLFGNNHPKTAESLNNLALLHERLGQNANAEELFAEVLSILKATNPRQEERIEIAAANLASTKFKSGKHAEAAKLLEAAIDDSNGYGNSIPAYRANTINNLGVVYDALGRSQDAAKMYRIAVEENRKTLGRSHPLVAQNLYSLALRQQDNNDREGALSHIREASRIYAERKGRQSERFTQHSWAKWKTAKTVFTTHLDLLYEQGVAQPEDRHDLISEGFLIAQTAMESSTQDALSQMAVRLSSGEGKLAKLIRGNQDAYLRLRDIDSLLIDELSLPPAERDIAKEEMLRNEQAALVVSIRQGENRLLSTYPKYAALNNPAPLAAIDVQALLAEDEAMLLYFVGERHSFLWLIKSDLVEIERLEIGREGLNKIVRSLRRSLDASHMEDISDIRAFDLKKAHKLYQAIIGPVASALTDITHLIVIADGALQSLPLGVLPTIKPIKRSLADFEDYRDVPWLVKKYAVTVLPSVNSLKQLRQFAGRSSAGSRPFAGIGDPLLDKGEGATRGVDARQLFTGGPIADADLVRKLPRLADTRSELDTIRRLLGGGPEDLLTGEKATERRVRNTDLSLYRHIAFATHGLLAGEFPGVAEPALVLTPPEVGSAEDDGLLTASEVAKLNLDADWVILSACNTAAADGTPGSEGLSGLARAFFYAGARALLVSHWAVDSAAAVSMTTGMFNELAAKELGRSEALRRAQLALMNDPQRVHFSHPIFWAPFIVVGEGTSAL